MIEIIDLKQFKEGACRARFTVKFLKLGMEIRECGLFEHDAKKWIGLPARQYESEGKKKYYNLVKMDETTKKYFDDQVFKILSEMIKPEVSKEIQDFADEIGDLPF